MQPVHNLPPELVVYQQVKNTGVHNFQGAKILVKHDMHVEAWEKYANVINDKTVVQYVKFGFPVGHEHRIMPISSNTNHSSAIQNPKDIDEYIATEMAHGAMIGPFKEKPMQWFMTSPLMSREKANSTKRRIILDLSFPKGTSVNDGIPKESYLGQYFRLKLPSVLTLRDRLRDLGPGAFIWTKDAKRGYRQLRSDPLDYPLLGIHWKNLFFLDVAVPFGIRNGAKAMQQVSQAVVDILNSHKLHCLAYIDDLASAHSTRAQANKSFAKCTEILKELGITEAVEKQQEPSTTATWLGIQFDTEAMQMRIPQSKIDQTLNIAEKWVNKSICTQGELRSLLGKLFFLTYCSTTLRLFSNRMLGALRGTSEYDMVTLDTEFHKDLTWIRSFLPRYNGVDIIMKPLTHEHDIVVDSCLTGGGGHMGNIWFTCKFPKCILDKDMTIAELEMVNTMVALRLFCEKVAGKIVRVLCDNSATISILQTGRGKCPVLLQCARKIWEMTAKFGVEIQVEHIAGIENTLADALSRAHKCQKARDLINERAKHCNAIYIEATDNLFIM